MADDSTQSYIRTYAKDVAALSGKAPVIPGTPIAGGPAPVERDEVLERLRARAKYDPVQEGDFLPGTMPTPTPLAASIPNSALPVTPEPVPAPPVVPQPAPPPAPLPNLPPPPPVPVPVAPQEFVPPAPAPTPVSLENVSPIHTYSSDFSDRIDTKQASTFSVLAAEGDAGKLATQPAQAVKQHKNALLVAFSFVLILLAGGGAYAAYTYVRSHASVPLAGPVVSSLVFADDRQPVKGEGDTLIAALNESARQPLSVGQVRVLYLSQASTSAGNPVMDIALPGGRLFGALQLAAPDILLRNIAPESTVGIVHAGAETRPFFILRVLSYERTFAGMLTWEGLMETELAQLYPAYDPPAALLPTYATSTTFVKGKLVTTVQTIPAPVQIIRPPQFVDEVASNHDVRALKDSQGRTIFLYGYRDKSTLIVARDESAFAELINRLSATKQQ
ncbi:MAG: hypothetical protein AAB472_00165 [Patescibacteria group bacterium]